MRTLTLLPLLGLALAGCPGGDDDTDGTDTDGADTEVSDSEPGETDVTGETDETDAPTGPVGSADYLNPTPIAPGDVGSGTIPAPTGPTDGNHFWSISSEAGGTYTFTVTSLDNAVGLNNCETSASAGGCFCALDGEVSYCCDADALGSCDLDVTVPAGETYVLVVYPYGNFGLSYNLSVTGP